MKFDSDYIKSEASKTCYWLKDGTFNLVSWTEAMTQQASNRAGSKINELKREIERLRAEVEEQCRLNGCGSEREAKLTSENDAMRAELEKANRGLEVYKAQYNELYDELAALKQQEPVGAVAKHTGSLKDMAIIVWTGEQPPEGTKLYLAPQPAHAPEVAKVLADWMEFSKDVLTSCAAGDDWLRDLRRRTETAAPQQEGK